MVHQKITRKYYGGSKKTLQKLKVITTHNKYMGGVDRADQIIIFLEKKIIVGQIDEGKKLNPNVTFEFRIYSGVSFEIISQIVTQYSYG